MILPSYCESLEEEADSLLQIAIQSGKVEYTGYTEREVIDQIIEDVDLDALSDEETRDEAEFQHEVEEDELLFDVKLTFSIGSISDVVKNNSERKIKREAAYRLLSFFNTERREKILNANVSNARILTLMMHEEGVVNPRAVKNYQDHMFFGLTPTHKKDWINIPDSSEPIFLLPQVNGEVWFVAPEPLSGRVIVAFRDHSVRSFPLDMFQDKFLSKVKIKKQKKSEQATPSRPSD